MNINRRQFDITHYYHTDLLASRNTLERRAKFANVLEELGSTEWVTNADGRPAEYFWYSPWGETLQADNSWRGRFSSPFKFTGHIEDEETGLTYAGARYYPARESQWLSVDPHYFNYPNLTPFHYAMNNPVNFIDPNGRDTAFADNQARQDYMTARNNTMDRIESVNKELEGASGKKAKRLQSQKDRLMKLKSDFDRIEDPNTPLVEYSSDVSGFTYGERQIGKTERKTDGKFIVQIRPGHDEAVIHENRHVNQMLDLGNNYVYNIAMELDAYRQQSIYDHHSVKEFIKFALHVKYGRYAKPHEKYFTLEDAIKVLYSNLK